MRALLDVNVVIALLDADHSLHLRAVEWFSANARDGWASCPLTQNGCIRIMSHPGYPQAHPVAMIIGRLADAVAGPLHEFWPDDLSLLDPELIDPTRVHGPRQITDLYLLALAVRHDGRLATFDRSIPTNAVRGAAKRHMLAL